MAWRRASITHPDILPVFLPAALLTSLLHLRQGAFKSPQHLLYLCLPCLFAQGASFHCILCCISLVFTPCLACLPADSPCPFLCALAGDSSIPAYRLWEGRDLPGRAGRGLPQAQWLPPATSMLLQTLTCLPDMCLAWPSL